MVQLHVQGNSQNALWSSHHSTISMFVAAWHIEMQVPLRVYQGLLSQPSFRLPNFVAMFGYPPVFPSQFVHGLRAFQREMGSGHAQPGTQVVLGRCDARWIGFTMGSVPSAHPSQLHLEIATGRRCIQYLPFINTT